MSLTKKAPIATVPVLTLNPKDRCAAYNEWANSLTNHCKAEGMIGDVVNILLLRTDYFPPEPAPPAEQGNRGGRADLANSVYLKNLGRWEQLKFDVAKEKSKLFARIMNQVSPASDEVIVNHMMLHERRTYEARLLEIRNIMAANLTAAVPADVPLPLPEPTRDLTTAYTHFLTTADPLKLIQSIYGTHYLRGHINIEDEKLRAREAYFSMKMSESESLFAFKQRTSEALDALRATGQDFLTTEESRAYDFLHRLSKTYKTFKDTLYGNKSTAKIDYPNTLDNMYDACYQYELRVEGGITTSVSEAEIAFHIKTQYKGKGGRKFTKPRGPSTQNVSHVANQAPTQQPTPQPVSKQPNNSGGASAPPPASAQHHTQDSNPKITRACKFCQQWHHDKECSIYKRALACAKRDLGLLAHDKLHPTNPTVVAADSGATVHIFKNPHLLTNIQKNTDNITIGGIVDDECFTPSHVGLCDPFGKVYCDERATANLLSVGRIVEEDGKVTVDKDGAMITLKGHELRFKRNHNLFLKEFGLVTTTKSAESNYTTSEVKRAQQANTMIARLGFPAKTTMIKAINASCINNLPATSKDVVRAVEIYGNIADTKGKAKRPSPNAADVKTNEVDTSVDTQAEQTIHADLLEIQGHKFLISFVTPLGLISAAQLTGKSAEAIGKKFLELIKMLEKCQYRASIIQCDGEKTLVAGAKLAGIHVEVVPSGGHETVTEVYNKVIQERVRTTVHHLGYKMPLSWIPHLVNYTVNRLNLVPAFESKYVLHPNVSAREKLYGRKTDYNKDCTFEFGEYVQAYNNDNVITKSLIARTLDCICLYPANTKSGSAYLMNLNTRRVILRHTWKRAPMPASVIKLIEECDAHAQDDVDIAGVGGEPSHLGPLINPTETLIPTFIPTLDSHNPAVDPTEPVTASTELLSDPSTTELQNRTSETQGRRTDTMQLRDRNTLSTPSHIRDDYVMHVTAGKYDKQHAYHLSVREAEEKCGEEPAEDAMLQEVRNLLRYETFVPVMATDIPAGSQVIPSSIFLKEKLDASGRFVKLKARIVAGGHRQDKSLYESEEISSPTVSTTSLFTLLALAASENRHVVVTDIASAYLNASMEGEPVYMRQNPTLTKFVCKVDSAFADFTFDGRLVVLLKKGLYGCVQSAKLWFNNLSKTLTSFGFIPNTVDPCVFNSNLGGSQLTVAFHVDDLIITSKDIEACEGLVEALRKHYGDITVHRGDEHSYLGMNISFDRVKKLAKIDLTSYIMTTVKYSNITGTATTPATSNLFAVRDLPTIDSDTQQQYRSSVAKLLFIATHARPDILLTVNFLATRAHAPTSDDMSKLNRLLKYLNGSAHLKLNIGVGDSINVTAYVDSSYGVHSDLKGHTGGALSLGHGSLHAKSSKQKLVAKSSTEAELIGIFDYSSSIICLREFLLSQGYLVGPATIHNDNISTLTMIDRGRHIGERTKHIHMRYFFIKDRVDSREVILKYLPTELMPADLLTKPLQGSQFYRFRAQLLGLPSGPGADSAGVCDEIASSTSISTL
jgi:hypothetical protein